MSSPLETPFAQSKQPQLPQLLHLRLTLQNLQHFHCPSLDLFWHLNFLLVVKGPNLNTGFKGQPHHCRVLMANHCPTPAGHTISYTSQDVIGLLGHLGTLLVVSHLTVSQHLQVFFLWVTFQPRFSLPQVFTPTWVLLKCRIWHFFIQLASTHWSSLLIIYQINTPNLVSSTNLLKVRSILPSRSLIRH